MTDAPTSTNSAQPSAQPSAAPAQPHELSAQSNAAMAKGLVERGIWSQQQADAALRGDEPAPQQQPAAQQTAQPVVTTAAAQQDEMTAKAFAGEASPASYRFDPLPQGVQHDQQQELAFRNFLHAESIPAPIAQHVDRLWAQAIQNPPDAAALERGAQECHAALSKMWGADMEANLKTVRSEIQRMGKTMPQLHDMLEVSGLGNSPWLGATILNMAKARGRA